jgi:hypothetical protein
MQRRTYLKSTIVLIGTIAALAAFATTAVNAADDDKKYSKEEFKSDAKAVGKGVKDAAVDVGHQVGEGSKKAYHSAKDKIKKDVKNRKPGDGSVAKKNESAPTATEGHK